MREISNQHAGKRVRIRGIIPMPDGELMLGSGDNVGVIRDVEGGKFRFTMEGYNDREYARLSVKMWRIAEIIDDHIDTNN